jgi:hypothetical protein
MKHFHPDPTFEAVAHKEAREIRAHQQCGDCAYKIVVAGCSIKPFPACSLKKSGGYGRVNCPYWLKGVFDGA